MSSILVPLAEVPAWQARGYRLVYTLPGGMRSAGTLAVMRGERGSDA